MTTMGDVDQRNTLSDAEFEQVSGLVYALTGIHIPHARKAMLAARLAKRLEATGIVEPMRYCELVRGGQDSVERDAFIACFTTNMTRFHRERHHFEFYSGTIAPELARKARNGDRVRIWSAGCSSGEEPYELAFCFLDACAEAGNLNAKFLASDIDKEILAKARAGIYPASALEDLPGEYTDRYFEPSGSRGDHYQVKGQVRSMIAFRQLNLNEVWPFSGSFDVIVCRNVAIYFDDQVQHRLWSRLIQQLGPGGYLLHGHSETMPEEAIAGLDHLGIGIYQRPAATNRVPQPTSIMPGSRA